MGREGPRLVEPRDSRVLGEVAQDGNGGRGRPRQEVDQSDAARREVRFDGFDALLAREDVRGGGTASPKTASP